MDNAVAPRVLERADALEADLDHLGDGQQARDVRMRLERRARHILHHEVAAPRLDHRVEDVDDVRMVELARERGLGDERLVLHALLRLVGALVEQEQLARDVAPGGWVAREVHPARSAAAELAHDRVFADVLDLASLHVRATVAISWSGPASW